MNVGLLWFDDDPKKPQERKIAEAAERYWQRFAVAPSACYVCQPPLDSPKQSQAPLATGQRLAIALPAVAGEAPRPVSLALVPCGAIRPNHFWVGVDDAPGG